MKVTLLITAYNEPESADKAVDAALDASGYKELLDKVVLAAPDDDTLDISHKYGLAGVIPFQDEGKGKAAAINEFLKKYIAETDILILTDGDVYLDSDAVEEILKPFADPKVGCVTGRVVPTNDPTTKWGYMAHTLALGAHRERLRRHNEGLHLEASRYLFAFRKSLIKQPIPIDVAEDIIIPLLIKEAGYKTVYASKAIVYVKYPTSTEDFIKQKVRTAKSHQNIDKYITNPERMKSFTKELARGLPILIGKTLNEISWTIQMMFMRLLIWYKARKEKGSYSDGWETIASTKSEPSDDPSTTTVTTVK